MNINERVLEIPIEEDLENTVGAILTSYLEMINNYFMELCSKITEYLDAIEQEERKVVEKPQQESKGLGLFKKSADQNQIGKDLPPHLAAACHNANYKPPVEYFKFVFSLEKLVQVCMSKVTNILDQIKDRKQLIKKIEIDRESILTNLATLLKVANQEIIEKINLHCHYILAKCLKKAKGMKQSEYSELNVMARNEIKGFIGPILKILAEQDDHTHNASRLLKTLAGNTIEAMLYHYSREDEKLTKKGLALPVLADDIIVYNELFQDIKCEKVNIIYQKFRQLNKY